MPTRSRTLEFIDRYGVTYHNGVDDKGTILIDYGVTGIPETLLLGCNGVLSKKFVGPINADRLRTVLDELMFSDSSCGAGGL